MEEIYKHYFEKYEVSNIGNVRRKLLNGGYRELKCSVKRGYKYFHLNRDGKSITHYIHQIVAKLFIGERPENNVIDHIDRDKLNNKVSNLRYCTHLENMKNQDRYKTSILEQDPIKRKKLINKDYYQANKEHFQEYWKKLFELKCDECDKIRMITRSTLNRAIANCFNVCKSCQSPINSKKKNK